MGDELLLHAVEVNNVEQAHLLLAHDRANVNAKRLPVGCTALHLACRTGNADLVRLLLKHGAEVNVQEIMQCGGRTPLHTAAETDHVEVASMLLGHGADSTARDSRGRSPLFLSAKEGLLEMSKLLLARGSDPNMRDFSGHNAAHWAEEFRHRDIVDLFAAHGAHPQHITSIQHAEHSLKCGDRVGIKPPKQTKKKGGDKKKAKK